MTAIQRWRSALETWAIPPAILEQTRGQSPWQLDPQLFTAAPPESRVPPGLATTLARHALASTSRGANPAGSVIPAGGAIPVGSAVLDVGCGGGAAGLALAPPAGVVIGVDESAGMLERFAASADERGVDHRTVLGRWPDVADQIPTVVDVVVCHHVVYNVADLDAFAMALAAAGRVRVVIELTPRHPQARNNAVWEHFWGVARPAGPTSGDALAVLVEADIPATLVHDTQINAQRALPSPRAQAAQVARMCCLGPERLGEVVEFLASHPPERVPPDVIWWDLA